MSEHAPGSIDGAAAAAVAEQAGAKAIVMYSTSWCGYCQRARNLFERKGLAYTEIKVDEEPGQREIMLQKSGGRRTVPQIFIGGQHVGGYDDLAALERSGGLEALLK